MKNKIFLILLLVIILVSLKGISACHCGDGIIQQPNNEGIYEECDDGNLIDGDGCSSSCLIEKPCHLELTKSVNKQNAQPGESLVYTIHYKNTGEMVCTGGGVKIQDVLDKRLFYLGNCYSNVTNDEDSQGLDFGWHSVAGYNESTNTLTWNAHTVSPNEEGTIKFKVIVLTPEECGDFEISNYFKAWSNQEAWKKSNVVNVSIDNECPPEPVCGDGIINQASEECDKGSLNGNLCWAGYGSSCTYCTSSCENKTITNYCGDGIKQECEECDDGNQIDNDNCSNSCKINIPEPTCNRDVEIRYSYSNSFGTGIALEDENNTWINSSLNLKKGVYTIKYFIDNKKEVDTLTNIILKIDNNTLLNYNKTINQYHSKEFSFNGSNFCGDHTLSLNITSDGEECNFSDNYASREIYVNCTEVPPAPICGNGIVETGEECDSGNLNGFVCDNSEEDCSYCSSSCTNVNLEKEKENNNPKEKEYFNICEPNWVCSEWTTCTNGLSQRSCTDTNHCGMDINKPEESLICELEAVKLKGIREKSLQNSFWLWLIILLLAIILALLIVLGKKEKS